MNKKQKLITAMGVILVAACWYLETVMEYSTAKWEREEYHRQIDELREQVSALRQEMEDSEPDEFIARDLLLARIVGYEVDIARYEMEIALSSSQRHQRVFPELITLAFLMVILMELSWIGKRLSAGPER